MTEFYTETLCLLHFREHGSVPGSCACGGLGPLNRTKHFAHGSPRHTLTALVAQKGHRMVAKMRRLVRRDAELYARALRRFERDLRAASERSGVAMACETKLASAWRGATQVSRGCWKRGMWGFGLESVVSELFRRGSARNSRSFFVSRGLGGLGRPLDLRLRVLHEPAPHKTGRTACRVPEKTGRNAAETAFFHRF